MSKYKEFANRYKESKLSQKEFARIEGISPSMVSYKLKRSRAEDKPKNTKVKFHPIQLTTSRISSESIEIVTSKGLKISIPI